MTNEKCLDYLSEKEKQPFRETLSRILTISPDMAEELMETFLKLSKVYDKVEDQMEDMEDDDDSSSFAILDTVFPRY